MNMKNLLLFFALILALLLGNFTTVIAQWSGPVAPAMGNLSTYSYTRATGVFSTFNFTAGDETVTNQTMSADRRTVYCNVTWTSTGAASLVLKTGSITYATLSVTVTCPSTSNPPSLSSTLNGSPTNKSCGPASFVITSASGVYTSRWYTVSSGGSYFLQGTNYTTPSLTSTTTYYVSTYYGSNCESVRSSITLSINAIPSTPTGSGTEVTACGTGSAIVSGTPGANGNSLLWYSAVSGGTSLSQGGDFITPTISSSTTYYISSYNTSSGCESPSRLAVTAPVAPVPSVPTVFPGSVCGSGTVNLSASAGSDSNTVRWELNDAILSTALTYAPNVSETTTFKARSYNSSTGCKSATVDVVATVIIPPGVPVVNTASGCSPGLVTLSGTPGASGDQLRWYSSSSGGSSLTTGSNYITPVSSTFTSFYVSTLNTTTGCESSRVTQSITIVPLTSALVGGSSVALGQGSVNLLADSPGNSAPSGLRWYSSSSGGSLLSQSLIYTTPILTYTGTPYYYYVTNYDPLRGCESSTRVQVEAKIKPFIAPARVIQAQVRVKGVKQYSQLAALPNAQKTTTVMHYDGLQRASQSIVLNASPSGKDIVQPMEYDAQGHAAKTYLPYTATTLDSIFNSTYVADQAGFYSAANDKVANDNSPFSVSVYESSPLGRPLEQGSPGAAWQPGTTHTQRVTYSFNENNEVRQLKGDGSSTTFYGANTLNKQTITDADGNQAIIFQNSAGQTLLKKQQLDRTINGTMVNWLETYYVYDDFGRVLFTISPKGVAAMQGNGWSFTTDIKAAYTNQVIYDNRGRVIEKKSPGQAWMYYGYDRYNRVVLIQDGQLRLQNKWMFIKYDQKGRGVMQGLYTNATQTTRALLQSQVLDKLYTLSNTTYPPANRNESRGTTLHGYSNVSFPKLNADNSAVTVLAVSYYDTYDFDYNGTADYSYTTQSLPGENVPARVTTGLATGSKRLVVGTANWLYSYVFYDEYNRPIQQRSNNHLSSAIDNLTTSVYDFEGKVLITKTIHKAGNGKETTIVQRQEYDDAGRLKNVYRPVAEAENVVWTNATGVTIKGNSITKTIGSNNWGDGGAFSSNGLAASQDGWIEFKTAEATTHKMLGLSDQDMNANYQSIDYALYLSADAKIHIYENGNQVVANVATYTAADIFSVERKAGTVYYKKNNAIIYTSLTPFTGALYADGSLYSTNSTLKDVKLFRENEKMVAQYEYNELGQVVDKKLHNTTGTTFLQSVDYRYTIRGQLQSINNAQLTSDGVINDDSNDHFGMEYLYNEADGALSNTSLFNGSISAVKWKGAGRASGSAEQQSYKYIYDKAGRLETATSQQYGTSAWNKEANVHNESMTYDHNGNIATLQRNYRSYSALTYTAGTMDNLTYTYNNIIGDQLEKVTDGGTAAGFNNGSSGTGTDFTYDASGNVLKDNNKGISAITYNILGKPDQMSFTDGSTMTYLYDAAGNKLAVIRNGTNRTDYVNGFQYENGKLSTYGSPEGRVVMKGTQPEYQYAIADHQGNTRVVFSSVPANVQDSKAGMEEVSNDSFQNYPTGGSRNAVSIYNHTAGGTYSQLLNGGNNSQVGLAKSYKVYPGDKVKIEAYAKYANLTSNSSNVSAFASALLNAFLLPAPVGGEIGTASTALNDWGSIVAAGGDGESNAAPHVSVNIILFDKNYNLVDAAFDQIDAGAEQVGVSPVISHDYLTKEYTVKEEGYVFMYIANENATRVDAYFDDVTMTYTPTNVVQNNDYYPFGLQTSTSWTRDENKNNFLYNQGGELNSTTGLYDLAYRNYDPAIGRFQQVDPLAAQFNSYSSYNYALNNPVMMNDPGGAKAGDPWGSNTGLDKTLGRLEAWGDFMDGINPFYSGSHGGGGGSGTGQWYRWSQYYNEQNSSYNSDLIARARSGDMGALNEYSIRYGLDHNESMQFFASSIGGSYYGGNEMAINPGRPDANGGMVVNGIPYVISLKSASAAILSSGSFWDTHMGRDISEFGNSLNSSWSQIDDLGDRISVFQGIPALAGGIAHSEIVGQTVKYASKAYYAEALNSVGKYNKVLGAAGKILGVTGVVTSGMILWNDPNLTNLTKFAINAGSLFLKANPVGLTISLGIGLLDATGYLDIGLNYIYNENTIK